MNTCPVYRRSGGFSYGSTIPGPIGSILSPGIDLKKYSSLPFASTLCGSCSDVCPVKIDIHTQLYNWRQVITKNLKVKFTKKLIMSITAFVFSHPSLYRAGSNVTRILLKYMPAFIIKNPFNKWTKNRELPKTPDYNFTEWYKMRRKNGT